MWNMVYRLYEVSPKWCVKRGATMTAVIYARYSSDSQREASIEGQLRDCKDYAEKNGITDRQVVQEAVNFLELRKLTG